MASSNELHAIFAFCGQLATAAAQSANRQRQNGFTLMELLIVISIIVILMLIAIPTSAPSGNKANELSAQKSLQTIEQARIDVRDELSGQRLRMHAAGARRRPGLRPAQPHIRASSSTASWPPASRTATSSASTIAPRSTVEQHRPHHRLHPHRRSCHSRQDRRSRILPRIRRRHKADPAGGTNCTQMVQ